ncbi:hypothetical protein BDZ89DRAFT_1079982 [Hymenopellis radicata]|nr:hypothetical protein BDZ89DRAFT_1079982 [Hymenopellis radicata]
MLAFIVSSLAGPVSWLRDAFLTAYDIIQPLPLATLVLSPRTKNIHFSAVVDGSRVAIPVHLQPSVRITLTAIRAMQTSGHQSSLGLAVDSIILHFQQTYDPTSRKFPETARTWRDWLGHQDIDLVFSVYPGDNSRWGWVTKAPGSFTVCILYELAHLASCKTLNPDVYPLPVVFFRFATLVTALHQLAHLIIMNYVFSNQVMPSVLHSGPAFEAAIFGGRLVGEWTSNEHVGEFSHLHGLYIRQTVTGEDYALSHEDVIRFMEIITAAHGDAIIPWLPFTTRKSSTPQCGHIRSVLMDPIKKSTEGSLHFQKRAAEATYVGTRVRLPLFYRGGCHRED